MVGRRSSVYCRRAGQDEGQKHTGGVAADLTVPPMPGSVSSLDSDLSHSDDGYDSDEEYLLAQQEWEESMAQLQQLFSIVVVPFVGRFLGRKLSYWGMSSLALSLCACYHDTVHTLAYARYARLGLGKSFFFGARALPPAPA
jgi:hypothetical protein